MKDLLIRLLKVYLDDVISLVKIRAVTCYVNAVAAARCVFITTVIFKCALLLMLAGFVLMHVALFMFLPWSPECKAVVLFILGGVYFLIALLYVLKLCSQKFWMEYSKASDLVKEVTEKK